MPPVVDDGDAAPTGYIPNGAAYGTNGSANGASYWANGAGYGPWPEEPAVHDVPLDRADDHPRQANGRYANGTHVNGGYVNGAYADTCMRRCVCRRWRMTTVRTPTGAIRTIPRPPHGPASAPTGTTGPSARTGSRMPAGSSRPTGITWPLPGATPISGSRPPPGRPSSAPGRLRAPRPPMSGRTTGPCRCPSSGRHRYPSRSPFAQSPSVPEPTHRRPSRAPRAPGVPAGQPRSGPRVAGPDAPAGDTRAVAVGAPAGRAAAVAVGRAPDGRPSGGRLVGNRTGARTPRTGPGTAATAPSNRATTSPIGQPVGTRRRTGGTPRSATTWPSERTGRATAGPSTDRPTTEGAAHPARTLCRARALHSPVHTGCTTPRGRGPRGQPPVARLS